jgi:hypothetical protein
MEGAFQARQRGIRRPRGRSWAISSKRSHVGLIARFARLAPDGAPTRAGGSIEQWCDVRLNALRQRVGVGDCARWTMDGWSVRGQSGAYGNAYIAAPRGTECMANRHGLLPSRALGTAPHVDAVGNAARGDPTWKACAKHGQVRPSTLRSLTDGRVPRPTWAQSAAPRRDPTWRPKPAREPGWPTARSCAQWRRIPRPRGRVATPSYGPMWD